MRTCKQCSEKFDRGVNESFCSEKCQTIFLRKYSMEALIEKMTPKIFIAMVAQSQTCNHNRAQFRSLAETAKLAATAYAEENFPEED